MRALRCRWVKCCENKIHDIRMSDMPRFYAKQRFFYEQSYSFLKSKSFDIYCKLAASIGYFHIFYWGYKWANEEKHNHDYYFSSLTPGGQFAVQSFWGSCGGIIGVASTLIWPLSTPLTFMNIKDRIKNDEGFFFPGGPYQKPKGWNKTFADVGKIVVGK